MSETEQKPKTHHSIWYAEHQDTSPVSRLRFSENELHLILGAVTFTADSLVKEFEREHKPFWLSGELFRAHEVDPLSDKGKLWKFHTDRCTEIKRQVSNLNRIERQLMMHEGTIDGSCPEALRTRGRTMH